MIDSENLTIPEARILLDEKKISSVELAKSYFKEIERQEDDLNALIEVFDESGLDEAAAADKMIEEDQAKALTGIPFVVKDNILIEGKEATAGSKILRGFVAPYTASALKPILAQSAPCLARANMDEFALGSSTETSSYGRTCHPKDLKRVPGGSSGGSAAAVASGEAVFSLGTDTGGSVRQPASFCGLVGMYPTYGSVSRYGMIAMGSSLDQMGPMTRTVTGCEIVFNAISGPDEMDATCVSQSLRDQKKIENAGEVTTIGVPFDLLEQDGIDEDIRKNFSEQVELLKNSGYRIVDVSLKHIASSLAAYYVIMPAEVSSNLARFDGIRYGTQVRGEDLLETYKKSRSEGFGEETKRRIMLGTYVLSSGYIDAYYMQATRVRSLIKSEFAEAFNSVQVIAMPTTPNTAFVAGSKSDPLSMYIQDIFTVPSNIAGVPSITVPSGDDSDGMPMGIQFTAPWFAEHRLFEIGKKFEKLRDK